MYAFLIFCGLHNCIIRKLIILNSYTGHSIKSDIFKIISYLINAYLFWNNILIY